MSSFALSSGKQPRLGREWEVGAVGDCDQIVTNCGRDRSPSLLPTASVSSRIRAMMSGEKCNEDRGCGEANNAHADTRSRPWIVDSDVENTVGNVPSVYGYPASVSLLRRYIHSESNWSPQIEVDLSRPLSRVEQAHRATSDGLHGYRRRF